MRQLTLWRAAFFAAAIAFMSPAAQAETGLDKAQVHEMLNSFHNAASKADFKGYFGHFTKDGIFLGTDPGERWTVDQFKSYTKPYFDKGKGWTYISVARNVTMPFKNTAIFDETLENRSYGTCRGTGVAIKTKDGWKISQYSLSIPIPNKLARSFVDQIREGRAASESSSSQGKAQPKKSKN